ncbi:hypothetical protein BAE44_0021430, partial [Dichanthelium oligosanthes]
LSAQPPQRSGSPSLASTTGAAIVWRSPRSSTCPTARRRSTTCSSPPTGTHPLSSAASACSATASSGTRSRPRTTARAPPPRPRMCSWLGGSCARSGSTRRGILDEDDWFARAFNETSWHFFEVDDDVDLAASTAGGRR